MKSIILVDNNSKMLLNFRSSFIKELVKINVVYVVCPLENEDKQRLISLGVTECINNPFLKRQSINPMDDYKLLRFYKNCFKKLKPDMVFNYTIKCAIWSSIAANKTGVDKVFSMITGLGYAFTDVDVGGVKKKIINFCVKILYKKSLKCNSRVFFLNSDDSQLFISNNLISADQSVVLNGEGVDLDYFSYETSFPATLTVLVLSRLLKDKGIIEYYEAAKILKKKHGNNIVLQLAGPIDDNPASISEKEFRNIEQSNCIEYLGVLSDVREAIKKSSIILLSSSYREGTPRSILEAMSMGRAVITTDSPGCRETVVDGKNGYLISAKSVSDIVNSIDKLASNAELLNKMGKNSRYIAETKYDVTKVNKVIINSIT